MNPQALGLNVDEGRMDMAEKMKRAYSPIEVLQMKRKVLEFGGAWEASMGKPAASGTRPGIALTRQLGEQRQREVELCDAVG